MDAKRWQRVKALYEEASTLPADARAAFVSTASEGDEALAEEVLKLLDVPTEASEQLQAVVAKAGTALDSDVSQQMVGPYRLLELIGQGGMGQVFLAERADDEFEQRVAIKMTNWIGAEADLIQRFQQERQILANLEHPNIARLLDGGRTDSGQPYLVMEYVAGDAISVYGKQDAIRVRKRLEMFIKICEAVQYAHSKLVIHRDIKPSNVLVTADGIPKLLDFGIAKLLDDTNKTELTRADSRALTPEYASPEQITGAPVTTATDIYGLGVLLYQLLSGVLPFDLESKTSPQIVELICRTQPAAPSSAAASRGDRTRAARLRGELDNIVLMAMRKDPERRYATAKDFADDVRAYLDNKPVSARGDSWRYRTGKFLKRHRAAALAASAVVTVGAAQTVFYTQELAAERDNALQERQVAETTTDFLVDLFNVSRPGESLGETITAREVLDRGAVKIRDELKDDDEIRARMLQTIGAVYQRLGLYEEAQRMMEEAVTLNRQTRTSDDRLFIDSLDELAWLHYRRENWQAAFDIASESLKLQRDANNGNDSADMARTLNHLGTITYYLDDYEASLSYYQRALATLSGPEHRDSDVRGTTLNHLGIVYSTLSRFDESEKVYLESLDLRQRVLGESHPDTATAYVNLGTFYLSVDKHDQAREVTQKGLEIDRKTKGEQHVDVAFDLEVLGAIELSLKKPKAALPFITEASDIWRIAAGPTHSRYARSLDGLADNYRQLAQFDEALEKGHEALRILEAHYGESHSLTADAHFTLGKIYYDMRQFDDAEQNLSRAIDIRTTVFGESHKEVWSAEQQMARVEKATGRISEAAARAERVMASIEQAEMTGIRIYGWLKELRDTSR